MQNQAASFCEIGLGSRRTAQTPSREALRSSSSLPYQSDLLLMHLSRLALPVLVTQGALENFARTALR